jgi:hydrogenase nickel incorporation protein HypA/HybF
MHELAVTESIKDIVIRHAVAAGAKKVTDIYIVIGRLASIVDDSVQFYWDFIAKDTICAGATLHFERKPARAACLDCAQEFTFDSDLIHCPNCGSNKTRILSGDEFHVESIAVENDLE